MIKLVASEGAGVVTIHGETINVPIFCVSRNNKVEQYTIFTFTGRLAAALVFDTNLNLDL